MLGDPTHHYLPQICTGLRRWPLEIKHTDAHSHAHPYIYTHRHMCTCAYTHIHNHTYTHRHMRTQVHTYVNMYSHEYTCKRQRLYLVVLLDRFSLIFSKTAFLTESGACCLSLTAWPASAQKCPGVPCHTQCRDYRCMSLYPGFM